MTRSLADLDATITVFQDRFPEHALHAARKGLSRLAQQAGDRNSVIPVDELVTRHDVFKEAVGHSGWYDERSALKRLPDLPEIQSDVLARIRTGEATMGDALSLIPLQRWGEEQPRVAGACVRFDEALFMKKSVHLAALRATASVMDRHFDLFSHLDFGLQPAGWATMKSRIRRAMRLVDTNGEIILKASQLSGPWLALVEMAKATNSGKGAMAKVWSLIVFCHRRDISPCDVSDETISALKADLEARDVVGPHAVAQAVIYGWERLSRTVPGWPQTVLSRLYQIPRADARPAFDDLPETLRAEWEEFRQKNERDEIRGVATGGSLADFVDDDIDELDRILAAAKTTTAAYSPSTIELLRYTMIELAHAASLAGKPCEHLADIVTVANVLAAVKATRQRQLARAAAKSDPAPAGKNSVLAGLVQRAVAIASKSGAPKNVVKELNDLREKIDPRIIKWVKGGDGQGDKPVYRDVEMGSRHRVRIEAFRDDRILSAWFDLPVIMIAKMRRVASKPRPVSLEEIGDSLVAVLYAITMCCPMRRANLAALTIAGPVASIWLPPAGKGKGRVFVPAEQVKNKIDLHVELDAFAVEAITLWNRIFRPALMKAVGSDPNNVYLFPAAGMGHRADQLLNRVFVDRNRRAGFLLNIHAQRHLCGFIILSQDPTQLDLVSQLLGHKNPNTTKRYYASVESVLVQRKFQGLLEARREALFGRSPNV